MSSKAGGVGREIGGPHVIRGRARSHSVPWLSSDVTLL